MATLTKAQLQKSYDKLVLENKKLVTEQIKLNEQLDMTISDKKNYISELKELKDMNFQLTEADIAGKKAYFKLEQAHQNLKTNTQTTAQIEPREAILINAH